MKTISLTFLLLCNPIQLLAQWDITSVESVSMDAQNSGDPLDFWLHVKITNTSADTLYVQGIKPEWFFVEAYIKAANEIVWERQNIGIDQPLEMLPIQPGTVIELKRRESQRDIGKLMLLTFIMSHSQYDEKGTRILLGEFTIPKIE